MNLRFSIVNADSRDMKIDDNSVNLTITSPYYRNAIDYDKHLAGEYYRGKEKYMSVDEYIKIMGEHFLEVYRVTKNGEICCIVIGNELDNGKIISLPSYFHIMMDRIGWYLQDEIIWYKVTGGKKRFRVTVQHPYVTYYYPNILHEKVLIYRKMIHEEIMVFRKEDIEHSKIEILELNDFMKKEIANSVWHIAPVPPNKNYGHPCPFPEDLVYRLIKLYSIENDLILDNFNGVGTTTKVAYILRRNAIGYDTVKEYCDIAIKRKDDPLMLRTPIIPYWKKVSANI